MDLKDVLPGRIDYEPRIAALEKERDDSTAEADEATAGMREVALFRAANAAACLGQMTRPLWTQLRDARVVIDHLLARIEELETEAADSLLALSLVEPTERGEFRKTLLGVIDARQRKQGKLMTGVRYGS